MARERGERGDRGGRKGRGDDDREGSEIVDKLAARIRFRVAPGFGERVIYRELFLKGLTLLDLREKGVGIALSMSHMAARQEVRALLEIIGFTPADGEELPI